MRCPLDKTDLQPLEYEGCLIYTCPSCNGELTGGDALAHIVDVRQETFGPDLNELMSESTPLFGEAVNERDEPLECPCCDTPMLTINYAGDTGILVDRCPDCSAVWLDQHELEMVQALLEQWQDQAPERLGQIAGKLEEARREAAEQVEGGFNGSRFSFVNAIINRIVA